MIPKMIHYCWFGRGEKPDIIKKCMESWQKFCPGYDIIEWNEDNFDIDMSQYVREAYDAKKWAFVSDYARFYALNVYGGIYVDTDVEMIKPIDELLEMPFAGFETKTAVAVGLIYGTVADNALCKDMLAEYDRDRFVMDNGSYNLRTVCHRVTDWLVARGLVLDGSMQTVAGIKIYPTEYFCPINFSLDGEKNITDNTYTIHHYAGSWVPKKDAFRGKVYRYLVRVFGENFANKVRKAVGKK